MQDSESSFVIDTADWEVVQSFRAVNGLLPEQQAQSA